MKWIYLVAALLFYGKMLVLPNLTGAMGEGAELSIVDTIVQESGIPNAVSAIIFRNRLYDTLFEVVVFTIAIMGVQFLLADEQPATVVHQFTDYPSIILARLGATIATLIGVELALRGHLTPGGGFAAGVAGGTAIALVAITSPPEWLNQLYQRWRAATLEKLSVLLFLALGALSLLGLHLPPGEMGAQLSGGWIPWLNILVALKVAIGSWGAILAFIRYRGLL
jgi:multicomponent Na+:H+ antiporter subunit B